MVTTSKLVFVIKNMCNRPFDNSSSMVSSPNGCGIKMVNSQSTKTTRYEETQLENQSIPPFACFEEHFFKYLKSVTELNVSNF